MEQLRAHESGRFRIDLVLPALGMELVFHNHCYEFRPIDGTNGFTYLLQHTDPTLVKLELDLYWLTQGGQDPMTVLKSQASRVWLIHMKDRTPGPTSYDMSTPQTFVELGQGNLDWPALLAQARAQGVKYAFLDQDETRLPITQSLAISRAYLRKLHV